MGIITRLLPFDSEIAMPDAPAESYPVKMLIVDKTTGQGKAVLAKDPVHELAIVSKHPEAVYARKICR